MRKSFTWTLGGTVVLSGVALWLPSDNGAPSAVLVLQRDRHDDPVGSGGGRLARPSQARAESPLPTAWPLVALSPAKRDLFAPVLPPAPPAPKPAKLVSAPPPPPVEPLAPMAPPMNYRYFGQMRKPDGTQVVYLSRGNNTPIQVAVGERLDDGYVVESVTEEGIQLVYPPLGVKALVNIPPAQR